MTLLKCSVCKEMKAPEMFHSNKSLHWRQYKVHRCKTCDSAREKARPHRTGNSEPKRKMAREKLRYAVRSGQVVRWPCCAVPECSSDKKPESHHPNYDAPLSVVWLCKEHHLQVHNETRAAAPKEHKP